MPPSIQAPFNLFKMHEVNVCVQLRLIISSAYIARLQEISNSKISKYKLYSSHHSSLVCRVDGSLICHKLTLKTVSFRL